ncbi:MAG TPA: LysM peptidoglycan-binding domain-containing protein [Planctomycetota bacterium]|nr:LysM peptidoglycan-binding domain-containing protein [Planctomycetota bacterium]
MSIGFRLFLLAILVFGTVWMSHFRREDLLFWLRAPRRVETMRALDDQARVSRVPPPVASIELKPPEPQPVWREPTWAEEPGGSPSLEEAMDATAEIPGEWALPIEPADASEAGDSGELGELGAVADEPSKPEGTALAQGGGGEVRVESPSAADRSQPAPPSLIEYTVKSGDSLRKIARVLLGKESRWQEIAALNEDTLRGTNLIHPGMTLRVPARSP